MQENSFKKHLLSLLVARIETEFLIFFMFGYDWIRHGSQKHILAHLIRNILADLDENACIGTQG